ncbi:MAG: transporter substrate-binding domain-containing protein [Spirochaetia bacterium]|nr:transporter substrate-binding domain-containing protein [Spirochaetia bacterium]
MNTIDSWPPYMFNENKGISGIATDIVRAAFKKAGYPAEIRAYPWARAYQKALEEKNTAIYLLYRTPEREARFQWVGPIIPALPMYFYKLKSRTALAVHSLGDAKACRVGVVRGVAIHKWLLDRGFVEGKNLEAVSDPQQNIKKLFSDRIDFLISNEWPLMMLMKDLGYPAGDVEQCYSPIESEAGYIGLHVETAGGVVLRLQRAFDDLASNGTVQAIQDQYKKNYFQ